MAIYDNTPTVERNYTAGAIRVRDVSAASTTGISVVNYGTGPVRQTVITLSSVAFSITDANAYGSLQLGTFPEGRICILGSTGTITPTTTSAIASTLNAAVTVSWGVGSAAASNATLATTMINMIPGTGVSPLTLTSGSTINVAWTAGTGAFTATINNSLDGTGTAIPIYLNLAVPTATDIDGDATLTISGTITITWCNLGDY